MDEKKPKREKKPPIMSALDPKMAFKDALNVWAEATKKKLTLEAELAIVKADRALAESIIYPKIESLPSRKVKWGDTMVSMKSWMKTTYSYAKILARIIAEVLTEEQREQVEQIKQDFAKPSEQKKLVLEGYEEVASADDL